MYDVNFIKYYPVGECLAQTLVDHYLLQVEVDKEGWRARRLCHRLFCIVDITGTRWWGQGDKVHTGRGEERRDMTSILTLIIPGRVVRPSPLHVTPPSPPPPRDRGSGGSIPPFFYSGGNSKFKEQRKRGKNRRTTD